jgi:CRP-like cAMP-binding protein
MTQPFPFDIDYLRHALLFKDAPTSALESAATFCEMQELNAGETLFQQDSPSDAMYILLSGQVHVVRRYADNYEVILATEGPYYVIGELSMLATLPRTGSVVAVSDCELLKLSRTALLAICEKMPQLAVQTLTHMGQRLYRLNLKVRESAIGNVSARLASLLMLMAGNESGSLAKPVYISRLARATAMDAFVVEEILRQWAMQGVITYENNQLTIHNLEKIQALAG